MSNPVSDFETVLKKVTFVLEDTETVVEVEYQIIENGSPYKQNFSKARAFPVERDAVSIIEHELQTLEFLNWRGIRKGKKT